MDFAVGNFLRFIDTSNNQTTYRFQNFHINSAITYAGGSYLYAPFGFSGVTINRSGDNTDANLVFPNNSLSRAWALNAINNFWIAHVSVMLLDSTNQAAITNVHEYYGRIAQGKWDETSLELTVNSILDAVGADVPARRLTQRLVGAIPVTSAVNMQ